MSNLSVNEAFVSSPESPRGHQPASLSACVTAALENYFNDLKGHPTGNLYQMVINEVEKPLLEAVMRQVQGNQTKAAQMLGINRSTLRKKLAQYDLNH
jgi:Fis family transcriptional regulator